MKLAMVVLLALGACSSKKQADDPPKPKATDAKATDAKATATPGPARVLALDALACILEHRARDPELVTVPFEDARSNDVIREAGFAAAKLVQARRADPGVLDELVYALAIRGDVDGGFALRALAATIGHEVGQIQVELILDGASEGAVLDLHTVTDFVLHGDRAFAEELVARPVRELGAGVAIYRGTALAAVGRLDQLDAEIAAAPEDLRKWFVTGALEGAVITRSAQLARVVDLVEPWIGRDDDILGSIADAVVDAAIRGHGAAVAPLRAALRTRALPARPDLLDPLWWAALIGEADDAELDAILATRADLADAQRRELTVARIVHRGTLDEALAAFDGATDLAPPAVTRLLEVIWARNVGAGFDPAVERRLVERCER